MKNIYKFTRETVTTTGKKTTESCTYINLEDCVEKHTREYQKDIAFLDTLGIDYEVGSSIDKENNIRSTTISTENCYITLTISEEYPKESRKNFFFNWSMGSISNKIFQSPSILKNTDDLKDWIQEEMAILKGYDEDERIGDLINFLELLSIGE